jgi:hypothetical protein
LRSCAFGHNRPLGFYGLRAGSLNIDLAEGMQLWIEPGDTLQAGIQLRLPSSEGVARARCVSKLVRSSGLVSESADM